MIKAQNKKRFGLPQLLLIMSNLHQDHHSDKQDLPNWASEGRREKRRYKKKKKKIFSKHKIKKTLKKLLNIFLWIILLGTFIASILIIILNIDISEGIRKKKKTSFFKGIQKENTTKNNLPTDRFYF